MLEMSVRGLGKGWLKGILIAVGAVLLVWAVPFLGLLLHSDETQVAHLFESDAPEALSRLEITDEANSVLWAIENTGSAQVTVIDYGNTPSGFRQLYPSGTRPRLLNAKEPFLVAYSVPGQGWARINARNGRHGFLYGMEASGKGCKTASCDEIFRFGGWTKSGTSTP